MDKFNEAHGNINHFQKSQSLIDLVDRAYQITGVKIRRALEVGCGQGINLEQYHTMGIDISSKAITKARENFPACDFRVLSSLSLIELGEVFSLVLDAHHIHYLSSKSDIKNYLGQVFAILEEGGLFCFEAMISHKEMSRPSVDVTILEALDYESMLVEAGFTIKYLMLPRGRKFIADTKKRAALSSDPDVLLVIATKEVVAK